MGHPQLPPRPRLVAPALALAVLAISLAAILFRLAPDLHPLTAAGWRLVTAGTLLSLLVRAHRARASASPPPSRQSAPSAPPDAPGPPAPAAQPSRAPDGRALPTKARALVLLGGLAYALHFGAWVASLGMVTVVVSVTAVTTTPILLAGVGLLTGRDRPSRRVLIGLALALPGVVLLAASAAPPATPSPAPALGLTLALVGAAAMGLYFHVARRAVLLGTSPWAFSAAATLLGGLLLLGTAALLGAPLLPQTATEAWVVLLAAAIPQLVGHTLMTWALRHTTPTVVALATLGEPVLSSLLAALLLAEALTPLGVFSSLLTLGAVAFVLAPRPVEPAPRPENAPVADVTAGPRRGTP